MAQFSKSTYYLVSGTIGSRGSMVAEGGEAEQVLDYLICDFADIFAEDNSKFDPESFVRACGATNNVCACGRWAADAPSAHRSGCAVRKVTGR